MVGVKQPLLSDKGSRSTYAVRFWGQVLRKYLRGTQGCPHLCFGGFSTYGEPSRLLSSMQPSGAISETGPIFIMFVPTHVALGHHKEHGKTHLHIRCEIGTWSLVHGDTTFKVILYLVDN